MRHHLSAWARGSGRVEARASGSDQQQRTHLLEPLHACGLSRLRCLGLSFCCALQWLDGLGALPVLALLNLSRCEELTSLQPVRDAGAVSLCKVNLIHCTRWQLQEGLQTRRGRAACISPGAQQFSLHIARRNPAAELVHLAHTSVDDARYTARARPSPHWLRAQEQPQRPPQQAVHPRQPPAPMPPSLRSAAPRPPLRCPQRPPRQGARHRPPQPLAAPPPPVCRSPCP